MRRRGSISSALEQHRHRESRRRASVASVPKSTESLLRHRVDKRSRRRASLAPARSRQRDSDSSHPSGALRRASIIKLGNTDMDATMAAAVAKGKLDQQRRVEDILQKRKAEEEESDGEGRGHHGKGKKHRRHSHRRHSHRHRSKKKHGKKKGDRKRSHAKLKKRSSEARERVRERRKITKLKTAMAKANANASDAGMAVVLAASKFKQVGKKRKKKGRRRRKTAIKSNTEGGPSIRRKKTKVNVLDKVVEIEDVPAPEQDHKVMKRRPTRTRMVATMHDDDDDEKASEKASNSERSLRRPTMQAIAEGPRQDALPPQEPFDPPPPFDPAMLDEEEGADEQEDNAPPAGLQRLPLDVREALTWFYTRVDPTKLKHMDILVKRFEQDPEGMQEKVKAKYPNEVLLWPAEKPEGMSNAMFDLL